MKEFLFVAGVVVQVFCASGIEEDPLTKALTRGADVNVGIRVVDDEGAPVVDAECCGWIYLERDAKHGCQYSAMTAMGRTCMFTSTMIFAWHFLLTYLRLRFLDFAFTCY